MPKPSARRFGLLVAVTFLAAALSLPWPAATEAQDQELDCTQEQTTQLGMNMCARQAMEASETSLAELVDELAAKLRASDDLFGIQERWAQVRDQQCTWEAEPYSGGSIQPLIHLNCLEAHNRQRIDRLAIFLCEGGGMTGPCEASRRYSAPDDVQ